MSTFDDEARFEERIRRGLVSRDPGRAPARLRERVAAAASEVQPRRASILRIVGVIRPAVATTLTVAAVLLGVLIVAVVRPGVGGSGTTPGPGVGDATPGPSLATVGEPLAMPFGWVIFGLLAVLVAGWAATEVYLRSPEGTSVRLGRLQAKRARGLFVLGLAAPILAMGQYVKTETSLTQGGFFEASLVHLEGMGPFGVRSHAAYFRYVPGGTATFVQSVRNRGTLPITVMGASAGSSDLELRLFAVHDPTGPVDVDTMPTYPLAPFELAPGEEREVIVVTHFQYCPGVPSPSSEPSPDLSGDFSPAQGSGDAALQIDTLGLTYSVLGFARDTDIPLYAHVVLRSPTGYICDTAWPIPSSPAP